MYTPPSAPRTIGGVLDDTIRLYRNTFSSWILISLILALMRFAWTMYLNSTMTGIAAATGLTGIALSRAQVMGIWTTSGVWEGNLVVWVINLWLYTALIANILAVASGAAPKPAAGFNIGIRLLPAAVLASILFGLGVIAGMILLIIPGLYVLGRWAYWVVALVDERAGGTSALGSSWRLVHGHWWRASTILGVLFILVLVLGLLVGIIGGIMVAIFKPSAATILVDTQLISAVLNIFFVPLFPAALVATYLDLKLRARGGDLAVRISNLQPT
jgi:hypothetical protein